MGMTATVTKSRVVYVQPELWNIVMHLELRDGATLVIDKDYSVEFLPGVDIGAEAPLLIEMMQADIDKHVGAQTIYKRAELAILASDVKAGLEV